MSKTKICKRCGRTLPLAAFPKNGNGGYRPMCKDCRSKNSNRDMTFRTIEHFLYYYDYEQEQLQQAEMDIIYKGTADMPSTANTAGTTSDKTGNAAMQMQKFDDTRKWLKVISDLLDYYKRHDMERRKFIEYKYFKGMTQNAISMELHIDISACSRWRTEIVNKGKELAAAAGLVSYDEILK